MKVKVKITEKLVSVIDVHADSVEEVKQKVEDEYRAGDIVFTADDFVSYSITRA